MNIVTHLRDAKCLPQAVKSARVMKQVLELIRRCSWKRKKKRETPPTGATSECRNAANTVLDRQGDVMIETLFGHRAGM